MLGNALAGLDIPADGSAQLVSVRTEVVDGCTQWTVVFKSSGVAKAAPPPQCANLSALPMPPDEPPTLKSGLASPTPSKSVNFAPNPMSAYIECPRFLKDAGTSHPLYVLITLGRMS